MRIVQPFVRVEDVEPARILRRIEAAGRTCYKSEDRITGESAARFTTSIVRNGHESVLEHEKVTVRFVVDRGVSHELVRHRIASFSQESTRFVDYAGARAGFGIAVIEPFFFPRCYNFGDGHCPYCEWYLAMEDAERRYLRLRTNGAKPEEARSVLPNSTKTEIVVTSNLREWRLILAQRTSPKAHPQMRQVMIPLLRWFAATLPPLFFDFDIPARSSWEAELEVSE